MTREEAIAELSVIWERLSHPEDCENGCYSFRDGDYLEALDMAIQALSADSVEIVRCKDCKRYESDGGALMTCTLTDLIVDDDCYCWWGERRDK